MKITRVSENRFSVSDISSDEFRVILDAVDDLNRRDNPQRPFSQAFEGLVRGVREQLSKGFRLFEVESKPSPVAPIYTLRRGPPSL